MKCFQVLTPRGWRQTTVTLSPRSTLYPTRSPASEGERCWFEREYHDVGEAAISPAAIFAGAAALVAHQAARAADVVGMHYVIPFESFK